MINTAPTYPGLDALFWLGVDRFNICGPQAYRMTYPHKDNPKIWRAYRMGIRAAEFGWSYDHCRKILEENP